MSSRKKWSLKKFFKTNSGCGCGGLNSTDIIEPKSKSKSKSKSSFPIQKPLNLDDDDCPESFSKTVSACPSLRGSLAVVKDSDDPYNDFRQSMLQMILEKEIYSRNDLQQLLECFLRLNSPQHHEIIVQVFMEIWDCGVSDDTSAGEEEETTSCSSTRVT